MIVIDDKRIYISNFIKILSIYESEIILHYKNYRIHIYGNDFRINYLSKDDIEIHGLILKVEFYE